MLVGSINEYCDPMVMFRFLLISEQKKKDPEKTGFLK